MEGDTPGLSPRLPPLRCGAVSAAAVPGKAQIPALAVGAVEAKGMIHWSKLKAKARDGPTMGIKCSVWLRSPPE